MRSDNHDTLVYRLAQILVKFNQGEHLDPKSLADEFGVNIRTIQRDMNVRFAYLPIQKIEGFYRLDPSFLGKFNIREIEKFAELAGVRGLFPLLSKDSLREMFDVRIQSALLVKGHHYENLNGKESDFSQLEKAIISHRQVSFDYEKVDGIKSYTKISPYKLINNKGIWYLAALDNEKLKTFSFSKICTLRILETEFTWDSKINIELAKEEGIWLSEIKQKIVLLINRKIAGYFKRRSLIVNQIIEEELANGDIIVSSTVGHPDQILPIVRYWIPHIRIVTPESMQQEMEAELTEYVKN